MNRSRLLMLVATALLAGVPAIAAEQTWTARISDSACGAKHEEAAEGAGAMTDRDCTLACVRGGSTYVLVADGKVYRIANQTFAGLEAKAGKDVTVTGTLKDGAIEIMKID